MPRRSPPWKAWGLAAVGGGRAGDAVVAGVGVGEAVGHDEGEDVFGREAGGAVAGLAAGGKGVGEGRGAGGGVDGDCEGFGGEVFGIEPEHGPVAVGGGLAAEDFDLGAGEGRVGEGGAFEQEHGGGERGEPVGRADFGDRRGLGAGGLESCEDEGGREREEVEAGHGLSCGGPCGESSKCRFPAGMTNKGTDNGKNDSRFPAGMTTKEQATARANSRFPAGMTKRGMANEKGKGMQIRRTTPGQPLAPSFLGQSGWLMVCGWVRRMPCCFLLSGRGCRPGRLRSGTWCCVG